MTMFQRGEAALPSPALAGEGNRGALRGRLHRKKGRIAVAAALTLLSACGQKDEAAAETAAPGSGPAMWVVEDEDSTVYLFGTFHILPSSTRWTTAAFDAAMAETPTTVTEVDTKSPEAQRKTAALVQELGFNPAGVTLSSILGPERAARFREVVEKYGASMADFEGTKPWLAMITLGVYVLQKEGFSAQSGAEAAILSRAAREGDAVRHLESAEYQIRALASLDEREILADFDASLEEFDDFDAYAKRVLEAWAKGDVKTLEEETVAPMRGMAPGAYKTLITDRNRNWAAEIEETLAGDEDVFIAVGAGHLVGEDSVVEMLEKKGRAVIRVQ